MNKPLIKHTTLMMLIIGLSANLVANETRLDFNSIKKYREIIRECPKLNGQQKADCHKRLQKLLPTYRDAKLEMDKRVALMVL